MGTSMDSLNCNYSSTRSEKARISVIFNKKWLTILSVLVVILLFFGVVMLALRLAIGWALIGLSSVPAMMVEWYNGELKHIPVTKNPRTIDDMMSGEVLGRLSKSPTPNEVATIVGGLQGGYFFSVRFGIGSKFLQELASADKADMQKVWKQAWDLQKQTNSRNISAAILIVAIIHCTPNYQTLISHLQLDDDDLIHGISWYNHLRELVEERRQPKRTGGVARDWSFGWTPLLSHFGHQMGNSDESLFQPIANGESIDQLINIFSKNGRQNVVLVGQPGVGKTEIVNAFAAKLMDGNSNVPSGLRFRQVFNLDAASLIAAAPDRGGLEQLIPRVLNEAYNSKNIIICLDNAELFFEEGIGSVDITNVLLPIIKAGNLRMILTIDEQRFLEISKRNSELTNTLNRITVSPANRDETIKIMQDQSITIEFQNNVTFMYQSLIEAYRLGDRYIHDQAMPSKAIKLLESSANYSDNGLISAESVRTAIEKTMGIKISVATDNEEREKLLNLEELIHGRMINQVRAVNVVSDALRRARAGVRNLNRPIGTFLFLGPTGVGKTELAKSLAEIYFKGEDQIIRVDMNEYVNSDAVNRLIADGVDNANSLTAQVMKQPFSVILLDEIEKAHTNVMSTLLQMLDEGIMRDIKNREVSFRDAIIVATSNAGADRIREYIDRGYDIEQFEDKFVDELISSNQFKPEFLNRFDEIVMFRSLNKNELLKVVDLMIGTVNKTLALQKVSVSVALDAKEYLVEAGYDPRLGARPMRRVVQRAVENTVAKQMLSGTVEPGSVVEISLDQVKQIIDSKVNADKIIEEEKVD